MFSLNLSFNFLFSDTSPSKTFHHSYSLNVDIHLLHTQESSIACLQILHREFQGNSNCFKNVIHTWHSLQKYEIHLYLRKIKDKYFQSEDSFMWKKSHVNKLWITFIFWNLLKDVRKINVTFEYTLKFFHNPTLHTFYLSFASVAFKLYFSIQIVFLKNIFV